MADASTPALDPTAFDALAEGVFSSATDAQSGQQALVDAYSQYTWKDPAKARDSLAFYGEQMKNLYKDQSGIPNIGENAPVKFEDIAADPKTAPTDDISLYNDWETENLKYVKNAVEPKIVANRRAYEDSIKDFASQKRAETRQDAKQEFFGSSLPGRLAQSTMEVFQGGALDIASTAAPITNAIVNSWPGVDNFSIKKYQTEVMDPRYQKSFERALVGAGANAAAFTVAPEAALGAAAIGGAGETVNTYTDTKRATGDTGAALEASALEGAGQVIGLAGEKIGFGRAASALGGAESSVIKSAGLLGGTAATQTVFSNAAQNIEAGKSSTTDLSRGVGTAAATGAIAGGVTHGIAQNYANRVQAKSEADSAVGQERPNFDLGYDLHSEDTQVPNRIDGLDQSTERATEIEQLGAPITPVTKQEYGPRTVEKGVPEEDGQDTIPVPHIDEDNNVSIDSKEETPVSTPLHQFEDGSVDVETPDGRVVTSHDDGTYTAPFDKNFYVDSETAQKVDEQVKSGEVHVVLDSDGKPVLQSTDGSNRVVGEIQTSDVATEGSHRLSVSDTKSPNKLALNKPVYISPRIKNIILDRSVGAASGGESVTQKETTFSQRLQATSGLPSPMAESGKEGIFYTPISFSDADRELQGYTGGTVAGLVDFIKSDNPEKNPELEARATSLLTNAFKSEFAQAAAVNDTAKLASLGEAWKSVDKELALKRTSRGRQFVFLKGADLESVSNITKAQDAAFNQAAQVHAGIEGIHIDEIKDPTLVDRQIENTQKELEITSAQDEQPLAEQESLHQQVINELESKGSTVAEAENATVGEEIKKVKEGIDSTETKLTKKKNKAIAKVEESIAQDTQELVNTIAQAQDLSGATKEEIQKAHLDREAKLQQASETTNAELKAVIDKTRAEAKSHKASAVTEIQDRYTKAKASADKTVAGVKDRIRKLELKKRIATDEVVKAETQQRIDAEGEKLVRARTRELFLKDELDKVKTAPDVDKETEDLLKELESGIVIHQEPQGKTRKISVKTKNAGLNLVQLFKKSKGAGLPALAALHDSVNNLASTFKQSEGAKTVANARIEELQKKIAGNRALVERAKGTDAATKTERKALDAARKQLAGLQEREAATPESRLSKPDRKKLDLYRSKLAQIKQDRTAPPKSEKVSALEAKIKELEQKKGKAERANRAASSAATEAVKKETANQVQIDKLQAVVDSMKEGAAKRNLENTILIMKGSAQRTSQETMELLHANFRNGIMSGAFGHIVGVNSSALGYGYKGASVIAFDAALQVRAALTGRKEASFSNLFLHEIFNKDNWIRGTQAALDIGVSGKRIGNQFKDSELGPRAPKVLGERNDPQMDSHYLGEFDWRNDAKNLKFAPWSLKSAPNNLIVALSKISGQFAGRMNRLYPIIETLHGIPFTEAFQAASAQYNYNRLMRRADTGSYTKDQLQLVKTGATTLDDLKNITVAQAKEFIYDTKANRAKAQTASENYANSIREAGVEFSPRQQRLLEEEIFQQLAPRMANMDAIKQVGQVNLNTPARGVSGAIGQWVASLNNVPYAGHVAKFITPFVRPVANLLGMSLEFSPIGLGVIGTPVSDNPTGFERSHFEKNLAITSAVLGTVTMGAITQLLLNELEKPEKERVFDIIGSRYSTDAAKSAAFKMTQGSTSSIRIGGTYIPFGETPLNLMLGSIGAYADSVRDGKSPDPGMLGALGMIAMSVPGSIEQVSMLKGITDIHDTITALKDGRANGPVAAARITLGMLKGTFIPATGLLRNVTRFTDSPTDGWRDIKSALFEGIPGVQTAYGKPALNLFGEPFPSDYETTGLGIGLHRVFSTANGDLDARWLMDSGYTIPTVNSLKMDKTTAKVAHLEVGPNGASLSKIDYDAKRAILTEAGPQMRGIVAKYRERYGSSASQASVQKNLKSEIGKVLAKAKLNYFKELDTQEE